jgi:mRNA interferase RelE/StbE
VYRLKVSSAAKRDLKRLEDRTTTHDFERLLDSIEALMSEPRPQGVRKIQGEERTYRIRIGGYRIIYEIYDNPDLVLILQISRRNEATYRSEARTINSD